LNIAKKTLKTTKIKSIIGGFHLIDTPEEKMNKIIEYLKVQDIKELYPCHCTDFNARVKLSKDLNTKNIGVGYSNIF
jgi:7,8-dihydropterin-6-yl-methyl-4-(beta-D-ribofuranosyl)aminobenzene 5'-phosphate synthase